MKKNMKTTRDRARWMVAGRTVEEQLDSMRKTGMHAIAPVLRQIQLEAMGVPEPKPTAENLIKLGCYTAFLSPRYVEDYFKLLHLLGVDYTYLETEYCCGGTVTAVSQGSEREKGLKAGKELMQINRDIANQKGVKTFVYMCTGCTHFAKQFYFPNEAERHVYSWDLIADKLKKKTLRIEPTVAGYFGGCGGSGRLYPPFQEQWTNYRQLLESIDGLTLVDVGKGQCCQGGAEKIVVEAERQNLSTIICPCNACYGQVNRWAHGRVRVKYLSDVLLPALGEA